MANGRLVGLLTAVGGGLLLLPKLLRASPTNGEVPPPVAGPFDPTMSGSFQTVGRVVTFNGTVVNRGEEDGIVEAVLTVRSARESLVDRVTLTPQPFDSVPVTLQVAFGGFVLGGAVQAFAFLTPAGEISKNFIDGGEVGVAPVGRGEDLPPAIIDDRPLPRFAVGQLVWLGADRTTTYEILELEFGRNDPTTWDYFVRSTAGTGGAFWNQEGNMTLATT